MEECSKEKIRIRQPIAKFVIVQLSSMAKRHTSNMIDIFPFFRAFWNRLEHKKSYFFYKESVD